MGSKQLEIDDLPPKISRDWIYGPRRKVDWETFGSGWTPEIDDPAVYVMILLECGHFKGLKRERFTGTYMRCPECLAIALELGEAWGIEEVTE